VLCMMTTFLFIKHEKLLERNTEYDLSNIKTIQNIIIDEEELLLKEVKNLQDIIVKEAEQEAEMLHAILLSDRSGAAEGSSVSEGMGRVASNTALMPQTGVKSNVPPVKPSDSEAEQIGLLKCGGKYIESEIIYWKRVPGDDSYESPITPHHGIHHDRYLSFEYDEGGWNNIRMGLVQHIFTLALLFTFPYFSCV